MTSNKCLSDVLNLRSTCRVLREIANNALLKLPLEFDERWKNTEFRSELSRFLDFMKDETNWKFCFLKSTWFSIQNLHDIQSLMSKYEVLFVGSVKKLSLVGRSDSVLVTESFVKWLKVEDTKLNFKLTIDLNKEKFNFASLVDDLELQIPSDSQMVSFVPFIRDIMINYSNLSTLNLIHSTLPIEDLRSLPKTLRRLLVNDLDTDNPFSDILLGFSNFSKLFQYYEVTK